MHIWSNEIRTQYGKRCNSIKLNQIEEIFISCKCFFFSISIKNWIFKFSKNLKPRSREAPFMHACSILTEDCFFRKMWPHNPMGLFSLSHFHFVQAINFQRKLACQQRVLGMIWGRGNRSHTKYFSIPFTLNC